MYVTETNYILEIRENFDLDRMWSLEVTPALWNAIVEKNPRVTALPRWVADQKNRDSVYRLINIVRASFRLGSLIVQYRSIGVGRGEQSPDR